jgi:hypothetical protein
VFDGVDDEPVAGAAWLCPASIDTIRACGTFPPNGSFVNRTQGRLMGTIHPSE